MRREGVFCLLLALVTLWAFAGVTRSAFLSYDDDAYVTANPVVRAGLTSQGMAWAFREPHVANYHPLTLLSHMLDVELFGLNAPAHHLTSLVLHVASALLLFALWLRMTGAFWPSAFVSAVFALHPAHVESVAWIAERKDVLSALFWMATSLAWVGYAARPTAARYLAAVVLYALGLLAKPMLVTLPFVLLLLDLWPLRRLRLGPDPVGLEPSPVSESRSLSWLLVEKVPLFALGGLSALMTWLAQEHAIERGARLAFDLRLQNALVAYVRYLGKLFWPSGLSPYYPHPGSWPLLAVVGAALLLTAITAAVLAELRRRPYLAVGWLWFVGTLVPVIGLVQVGDQSLADRYTYIPYIGLTVALAWGLRSFGTGSNARRVLAVAAGLALALCALATRAQVGYWRTGQTLFERALELDSDNGFAHHKLGLWYEQTGDLERALSHHEAAARLDPSDGIARYNLGTVLLRLGRPGEALPWLQEAVRLRPEVALLHLNLGLALQARARTDEALAQYREAARLAGRAAESQPGAAAGDLQFVAAAYAQAGRYEDAIEVAERALAAAYASGQRDLARQIETHLTRYRERRPFRR